MIAALSILYGLLSMVGYSMANVFSQPLAKKLGTAQILFLRGFTIVVLLLVGTVIVGAPLTHYRLMLLTFALGLAGYLPLLAFTHGIKVSRIGVITPVAGSAPLVTVVLSFLILNTAVNLPQWLAIVAVVGANVAMSIDLKNWRNSQAMKLSSGIPFALIAALGWGAFYFFLVTPARDLGPWLSALIAEFGVTLAAGLHIILSRQKFGWRHAVSGSTIINGALVVLGTVAYTIGASRYNVSLVATLSNSTAVLSALLATYLFHEHLTRKEKILSAVMIGGICAITLL